MEIREILEFVHSMEKLKGVERHSCIFSGRKESVAEHSWRVCLIVMIMMNYIKDIDQAKALKMAIIHDINEASVGYIPSFLRPLKEKHLLCEENNMHYWQEKYKLTAVDEIAVLWDELRKEETREAKMVRAADKLETRIQHNEAPMETWNDMEYPRSQFAAEEYCSFDEFLRGFNELVKEESKKKILSESEKDWDEIMKEAEALQKK